MLRLGLTQPTQTHYRVREAPHAKNASVHWAIKPNGTIVIFVHGFAGGPTSTWPQFPTLLPAAKAAREADILFYSYDSLRTRAYVSAVKLYKFLTILTANPNALIQQSLPGTVARTGTPFAYSRIIIVAHSLGALVSRLALLEAHKNNDAWAANVRLILFAPAHTGADILRLAGLALTGLPVAMPAAQLVLPSLQDLDPRSSAILKRLAKEVSAAVKKAPYLRATVVIHAERDPVVSPNPFCTDPTPLFIPGVDHMSVCKPNPPFSIPLDQVTALL